MAIPRTVTAEIWHTFLINEPFPPQDSRITVITDKGERVKAHFGAQHFYDFEAATVIPVERVHAWRMRD